MAKCLDYKCKCGCENFHITENGNNKGIYCDDCGSWLKWGNKKEIENLLNNRNNENNSVCEELHKSRTLYRVTVLEDGDVGLKRIKDVHYCPICGKKINK